MKEMIERLKKMANKDWTEWTSDEHEEYKKLAQETGISIGLDNNLYQR